jgi:arsenite-transporting ATPase
MEAIQPAGASREVSPTRLILYVGKGGVGKTTVAAATAVRAAELGRRTLVVSTDIAHSLGDVLQAELGADPQPVAENLYGQEINVLEEVRRTWGQFQAQVADLLRQEGLSEIQADELAIFPGMEEVAALVQIGRRVRSGDFDCIVVDAAPTGETVRLLSMPDSFRWYAGRVEAWRGRLMRFLGPFMRGLLPNLDMLDVMRHVAVRVDELRAALTDARRSSYRIVVTPDRMVLKEARRAETYLNLFAYPIDAVVVNRVWPPDWAAAEGNSFAQALHARQEQIREEIQGTFPTLPRFEAPLMALEPIGTAALAAFARRLFGDRDPAEVMHVGATLQVERAGAGYVLRIPMPNVELGKLSLVKRGDELYVDVGNFRRHLTLPAALAALEPGTARLQAGALSIPFRSGAGAGTVAPVAAGGSS